MDFLERIRFSDYLSRSSISFLSQLESFRKSFDLLSNIRSNQINSSASKDNLSTSLTNSHTISWRRSFFYLTCSSWFITIFLFNCFSAAFFSCEHLSWNCLFLNWALLTDFIISAVMLILLAVTFLDVRWLWIILRETRRFSEWLSFIHSLFVLKPRSTADSNKYQYINFGKNV